MTRRIFSRALTFAHGATILAGSTTRARRAEGGPAVILTAKSAGEVIGDLRYLIVLRGRRTTPGSRRRSQALDGLKDPAALPGARPSKPLGVFASLPAGPGETALGRRVRPGARRQGVPRRPGRLRREVDAKPGVPGFSHKIDLPGGNCRRRCSS